MCIRDSDRAVALEADIADRQRLHVAEDLLAIDGDDLTLLAVSYTHLRAHETVLDLVCRLLLENKNKLK